MAALGDEPLRTANTDYATWAFGVPPWATMTAGTLWRAGDTAGGGALDAAYEFSVSSPVESSTIDRCGAGLGCPGLGVIGTPFAEENLVLIAANKLGANVYARAKCGGAPEYECPQGQGDANHYAAVIYLYAADLTLEQTAGPAAGNPGGELATAPVVAGTSDLTFSASDPGAGVYEAIFSVDGQVVQRSVLDEDGGRCRDVGQTGDGLPAFLYLQPCPASLAADVGFDTTHVGNGPHHLVVSVIDAAGNAAPVLDRTVTVANPGVPGPPNGIGASEEAVLAARWARTRRSLLSAPYGRAETITGRLTGPGGQPIAHAAVEVAATPTASGARTAAMRPVLSGTAGGFTVVVPARVSSRTITLSYRARLGDPAPAASGSLRLAVSAPVSLTIEPRIVRAGGTIHFAGRLRGGPVPPGGKQLVLEARSGPGRWLEFDVIRSDRRGRYRSHYTFRFPGPARYQVRVLCEQEADYPYARGVSPVVRVRER